MEGEARFIFYKKVDFNNENYNVFSLDTRDFHVASTYSKENHKDWETIKKYPHFFHTLDQLKELLDRYFNESGGAKLSWRYFKLENCYHDWDFKYFRIYRTKLGFLICDRNHKALKSDILNNKVSNF